MSGLNFDASEVSQLAVDLTAARGRIQRSAPKVMARGALNIKREMRQDFSGHRYLPDLSHKVNYDQLDGQGLACEIGIDKGGQGDLGNVAAYGTSNNAPVADKNRGLLVETPRIIEHLGEAAEDAALGGGQ